MSSDKQSIYFNTNSKNVSERHKEEKKKKKGKCSLPKLEKVIM